MRACSLVASLREAGGGGERERGREDVCVCGT